MSAVDSFTLHYNLKCFCPHLTQMCANQSSKRKPWMGRSVHRCWRLLPSLHHPLTPPVIPPSQSEGGGTDSSVESKQSRRASSRGKKERNRNRGGGWGNPGVLVEKYRKSEHGSVVSPVILHHPASVFHPCDFLHGPLAPWPRCLLPFLSRPLLLCPGSFTTPPPRWRPVCRQQSLNLTLLLYDSAGPVTD